MSHTTLRFEAIDSLIGKFESVGMRDMIAVGSATRMGEVYMYSLSLSNLDAISSRFYDTGDT